MASTTRSVTAVVWRVWWIMVPAGLLPALTWFEPLLNPFVVPHVDLSGSVAVAACWLADSGGLVGIPLLGIVLTQLIIYRPGMSDRQRASESLLIAVTLLVLLGGGVYLNEQVLKPLFAVPRPNVLELAQTPPHRPLLGMSVENFYGLPDNLARSLHLEQVLPQAPWLHECVREHWISETGYSFPSGHSFASMMFTTFFLAMGLTHFTGPRLWILYLLVTWSLAVCLSRPLLRVHSPTDVCVGCLEGIVTGLIAFLLVRTILARLHPTHHFSADRC